MPYILPHGIQNTQPSVLTQVQRASSQQQTAQDASFLPASNYQPASSFQYQESFFLQTLQSIGNLLNPGTPPGIQADAAMDGNDADAGKAKDMSKAKDSSKAKDAAKEANEADAYGSTAAPAASVAAPATSVVTPAASVSPTSLSSDPLIACIQAATQLLATLLGGNLGTPPASAPTTQVTTTAPASTPAPAVQNAPAAAPAIQGVNDPNLQKSIAAIAADPEGRKLLDIAAAKGVKISVGDTGGANILGFYDPNKNSITIGDGNNVKTLVHELVHAVSAGDGNSKTEEGIADVIGKRVESRVLGTALEDPNVTFQNKFNNPAYRSLANSNNIRQTLNSLGIVA